MLNPDDPQQALQHKQECAELAAKLAKRVRDSAMECGICFEKVMSKADMSARRFGLMACDHAFCLGCIRNWRATGEVDAKTVRLPRVVWLAQAVNKKAPRCQQEQAVLTARRQTKPLIVLTALPLSPVAPFAPQTQTRARLHRRCAPAPSAARPRTLSRRAPPGLRAPQTRRQSLTPTRPRWLKRWEGDYVRERAARVEFMSDMKVCEQLRQHALTYPSLPAPPPNACCLFHCLPLVVTTPGLHAL